jgi:hypothetical protein
MKESTGKKAELEKRGTRSGFYSMTNPFAELSLKKDGPRFKKIPPPGLSGKAHEKFSGLSGLRRLTKKDGKRRKRKAINHDLPRAVSFNRFLAREPSGRRNTRGFE